jgi:hypothetical protein
LFKLPTDGDIDQFTLVLLLPLTVAFKVVDWPPIRNALEGVSVTDTAGAEVTKEMVAVAVLVGSAALAAVTVTFCAVVTSAGAV